MYLRSRSSDLRVALYRPFFARNPAGHLSRQLVTSSRAVTTAPDRAHAPAVWDDFNQIEQVHEEINRMFEQAFVAANPTSSPPSPSNAIAFAPANCNPFEHMQQMRQQIDTLFDQALQDFNQVGSPGRFDDGWTALSITPAMIVHDQGNAYEVVIHLPGVDKGDIQITLNGTILTVAAEQHQITTMTNAAATSTSHSHSSRRFERKLRLPGIPPHPEDVKATLENGVLRIVIPKAGNGEEAESNIRVL
jgi:HSP20 family molecular chaperone IbpA